MDTVAKLQGQGVTGVSFVALSGGTPDAPLLEQFGEIKTEKSALQSVIQGAPELMEKAIGQTVTLLRTNPATGVETRERAKVLSTAGGVVIQITWKRKHRSL